MHTFKEKIEPYKVELIEIFRRGEEISHSQGDWTDLCAGPHPRVRVKGIQRHSKLLSSSSGTGEAVRRTQCLHVSTEQPRYKG